MGASLRAVCTDYATFCEYWDAAGLVSRHEFELLGPLYWARDIAGADPESLTAEDWAYKRDLEANG
jgi:hypothetical protein